jgi:hypothetical protein
MIVKNGFYNQGSNILLKTFNYQYTVIQSQENIYKISYILYNTICKTKGKLKVYRCNTHYIC